MKSKERERAKKKEGENGRGKEREIGWKTNCLVDKSFQNDSVRKSVEMTRNSNIFQIFFQNHVLQTNWKQCHLDSNIILKFFYLLTPSFSVSLFLIQRKRDLLDGIHTKKKDLDEWMENSRQKKKKSSIKSKGFFFLFHYSSSLPFFCLFFPDPLFEDSFQKFSSLIPFE